MSELFNESLTFAQLGISEPVNRAIEKMGFKYPTGIQADLIPVALEGRDILGQSRTGSGKTAAFGIPLLERIEGDAPIQALVLGPTRELAIQTAKEIRELARFTDIRIINVTGGEPIKVQADQLDKGVQVVVGTPGRVIDMHRRGLLSWNNIRIAVLDEVDRMLDIGFRDDIRRILGAIKSPHQTMFVSATISDEIDRLARAYMRDPVRLNATASGSLTVHQVTQRYFSVEAWDKRRLLLHLLTHEAPTLTLVFCRTKHTVNTLSKYLREKGIDVQAMHGDMYQTKRNKVMTQLRQGKLNVVIASDLAARGLDVDNISHVINYDLPEDPEIYVHRIGRTARAGRFGIAWSFVTPEQGPLLTAVEMFSNVEIPREEYDDFTPGPVPADIAAERMLKVERQQARKETGSRAAVSMPSDADPEKFPGGLVPTQLPRKRMGGRVRTRRR
ncbi:MAG: DEAD/DEAH box helicase [Phycisphaerales bacterium]|nr:DEAD/DEAH box helicase [Phycisphaerales bacterium]